MKINKKILACLLAAGILLPDLAYAAEVVIYDKSNIDDIYAEMNLTYDKEKVEERKNELTSEAKPKEEEKPNILPTDKEIDQIAKDLKKYENSKDTLEESDIYPKVPVYEKVVDISEHQRPKNINYDKLANSVDGAILRSSIRLKNNTIRKDIEVENHYRELNKRNVPLGFYHYSRAINEKEAIEEANYVLNVVRNKKVSLPIYIDIEDNDRQAKATKAQITAVADAFTKAIRRNGYVAGIYSYPHFANKYLSKKVRDENEFWIAEWKKDNTYPKYKDSHYDSWQYSSKGGVYGYKGDIDKNILYRDYPLIMTGISAKGYETVADEVLAGKWGNGLVRKKRLEYAGYNYKVIQDHVNKKIRLRRG